jgi:hypothetical protein
MTKILNKDPQIILELSFLNQEEIFLLLNIEEYSKNKVVMIGSDSVRNSKTYIEKNNEFNSIKRKIFNFLNSIGFDYDFKNYEEIRIIKYEEGQEFTRHFDFFNQNPNADQVYNDRVATVLIYLEEPIKGGKTIFNDLNIEVSGEAGSLLFYRYDTPLKFQTAHTGEKVLKGTKIILGMCIREKEFLNN